MEHRYSERVPAYVKLKIYSGGIPVAIGHVRNVCRDGMFVETDYNGLRHYQKVECEFRLGGEDMPERHRICAHVLRQASSGFALELDETDDEACAEMQCLLRDLAVIPAAGAAGFAGTTIDNYAYA
jgi:hypothetical protein